MCGLERQCLLLLFGVRSDTSDIDQVTHLAVLDLVCVDEPDVVAVIANELSRHLQDLLPAHFLDVVAHLQALDVSVSLELTSLKQFQLVSDTELLIIDLFAGVFIAAIIKRCLEFDSNGTRISLFGGKYARLDEVDHLFYIALFLAISQLFIPERLVVFLRNGLH